jgi:NitT/TauT family transport system permease protein
MKRLFEPIGRRQYVELACLGFITLTGLWLLLTLTGLVSKLFLPSPGDVLHQITHGPTLKEWLVDLTSSCTRVFTGFLLAALIGIPVGLYIGTLARVDAVTSPLVEMARYVPVPALLPLCILWAGVGESQKILVIFLGTFFQLIVAVAAASRSIPREFIDVARTLGLSEQKSLWRVVLPAAWPSIFETLQISLGWAWSYLVVAEIVAAGSGIGYRIMWAHRYLQVGLVFVNILELALLGLVTDLMFRLLRKRLFQWAQ